MRSFALLLTALLLIAGADGAAASSPEFVPGYPLYCQGPIVTSSPSDRETTTPFHWAATGAGAASPGPGQCSWADRTGAGDEKLSWGGNTICDFSGAMKSVPAGAYAEVGVARDPQAGNCMHLVRYIGTVSPPFSASPALAPFVRPSIAVMTPSQIASLRRGIQVMMSRPNFDVTSYSFQANIHATYDSPFWSNQKASWNQCEHGSYYFFSWHRMYLYFFDRILRAAAGDPKLVLPYWNWTDPAQYALPVAFRLPANAGNPLYIAPPGRPAVLDDGTMLLGSSAVEYKTEFANVAFDSPAGTVDSFGGQIASPLQFNTPHGAFESQPHDLVHTALGGLMADPGTAAQDPVFWLHHANVDRMWNTWLAQGGGRHNPTDAAWLNTQFTFYDEAGHAVYLTGAEIVDTVGQLNYKYDDHPDILQVLYPPPNITRFLPENRQFAMAGKQAMFAEQAAAPIRAREELATRAPGAALQRIELGGTSARVAVPLANEAVGRIRALVANNTPHQVYLRFDDIRIDQMSGVYYEIYVNPPAGAKLDIHTPGYVGSFSPFGLKPHAMAGHPAPVQNIYAEYDISHLVSEAIARDPKGLTVVLVPRGLFDLRGEPAPVSTKVQGTLGTIRIIGG